jgi:hypothetical protein
MNPKTLTARRRFPWRVQSWCFEPEVDAQLQAIRSAATYLHEHQAELGDLPPVTVTRCGDPKEGP